MPLNPSDRDSETNSVVGSGEKAVLPIGGEAPIRPGRFLPLIHWLYPLILFGADLATWVVSYTVLALVFDKYQNYGASELLLPPLVIGFLLSLVGGYKYLGDTAALRYAAEHFIACIVGLTVGLVLVYLFATYGASVYSSRGIFLFSGIIFSVVSLAYRRFLWFALGRLRPKRGLLVLADKLQGRQFYRACLSGFGAFPGSPRVFHFDVLRDLLGEDAAAHADAELAAAGRIPPREALGICRGEAVFDIVVSGLGVLLSAPLMLVIAALIRLEGPGPVIFRQTRVGQHRRLFTLLKFRTMRAGSEEQGIYTEKKDNRITRVGRVLRAMRFDELPQFFNVLRGDMSLIGPRAEWIKCVEKYEEIIPHYHFRHLVRPGITGWAQVNYPYGASTEDAIEKLMYDLYYIRNFSLTLDASVTLKTIHTMIFGKGQ